MTTTDLATFQEVLLRKRDELSHNSRTLESIEIERTADALEEAQNKSARELAVSGLARSSTINRNVAMALVRIEDGTFGTCVHCGNDIARRRLDAVTLDPILHPLPGSSRPGRRECSREHRADIPERGIATVTCMMSLSPPQIRSLVQGICG
jgi:DnaK suppressor protein